MSYIDQFGAFFDNMKVYEHFEFINHLQESQYDQAKMNNMLHPSRIGSYRSIPAILLLYLLGEKDS